MSIDWHTRYKAVINNKPSPSTILRSMDGKPVRINIELTSGRTPFLYALLYVPTVVESEIGWFARSIEDRSIHGWKAILMPRARDVIINHPDIPADRKWVGVEAIKVIRESQCGKSLLVEIQNYGSWLDNFIVEINRASDPTTSEAVDRGTNQQPVVPCDVPQADGRIDSGDAVQAGGDEVCDGAEAASGCVETQSGDGVRCSEIQF